jgi:hypothetical protein
MFGVGAVHVLDHKGLVAGARSGWILRVYDFDHHYFLALEGLLQLI